MREDVVQQTVHMFIGQCVEDMLGLPSPSDQPRGVQDLKAGRNTAELGLFVLNQFGHATLAMHEPKQQPKP